MKKEVVVQMSEEFGATPIAHLVQVANQFDSRVYVEIDSKKVNAKSIMGMMSLVLTEGETVVLDIEGSDETDAIKALEDFFTGNK